jgi:ArsR family metal-binding transcriptional regulator
MPRFLTTFPDSLEFEKACAWLDSSGTHYEVVSPSPGYGRVGVAALIVEQEGRARLAAAPADKVICSGWVEYRPGAERVPADAPPSFAADVFGRCAIMVLAPCVTNEASIRLIAHISGDLGPIMPYLNATLPGGVYSGAGPAFTFMDGARMITLYSHRITIAKAVDLVDGWRVLEHIRVWSNDVWQRRATITPCHIMRQRPPAVTVFKHLPGINCRACGEKTCMAFAVGLWKGEVSPARCEPVFSGEYKHLLPALMTICVALGVDVTELQEG